MARSVDDMLLDQLLSTSRARARNGAQDDRSSNPPRESPDGAPHYSPAPPTDYMFLPDSSGRLYRSCLQEYFETFVACTVEWYCTRFPNGAGAERVESIVKLGLFHGQSSAEPEHGGFAPWPQEHEAIGTPELHELYRKMYEQAFAYHQKVARGAQPKEPQLEAVGA